MNRKVQAESGGRPSKGNYFEERAEKGSFLFNFKVSKDLRKQDGLKTRRILTVKRLFGNVFYCHDLQKRNTPVKYIALQSSLFGLRRIYLFGFLWYDMG